MNKRQKRCDREALLQGTALQKSMETASQPLPKPLDRPTQPQQFGHKVLEFELPENREGQTVKRPRKSATSHTLEPPATQTTPAVTPQPGYFPGPWPGVPMGPQGQTGGPQPGFFPGPWPGVPMGPQVYPAGPHVHPALPQPFPQGFPGYYGWPPYFMSPFPPARYQAPCEPQTTPATDQSNSEENPMKVSGGHTYRQREWRQKRALKEDSQRIAAGLMPKKRHQKGQYRYICSKCNNQKCAETGHTQVKGKWYCPSSGITVEEWKAQINK